MRPERIAAAYVWACELDVATDKPGNVSRAWPGHRMTADLFERSARMSAPGLTAVGATVGARIEAAVRATQAEVGCNTNLGIVLLCAPLAAAAERCGGGADDASQDVDGSLTVEALRTALAGVLAGLTVEDAAAAFRAIALAQPAGLGEVDAQNVHATPSVNLREAMALAADRDRIARQYTEGFSEVFARVPRMVVRASHDRGARAAMLAVYLDWLASGIDSHIVRKHGEAVAQSVTARARELASDAMDALAALDVDDARWAAWDVQLKQAGLNPGTSADLSVATAFVAALCGAA